MYIYKFLYYVQIRGYLWHCSHYKDPLQLPVHRATLSEVNKTLAQIYNDIKYSFAVKKLEPSFVVSINCDLNQSCSEVSVLILI